MGIPGCLKSRELTFVQKWMLSILMTGVTVIGARLSSPVPGTPVPITFQVFGVLLSGLMLGGIWGAISQIQYLALGCIGAPVFALGHSGIITLFGVTGGYLWSYPIAAFVVGYLAEKISDQGSVSKINMGNMAASIVGLAIIYFIGTLWLITATHQSLFSGVIQGLLIFLAWDIVKAVAAVLMTTPRSSASRIL